MKKRSFLALILILPVLLLAAAPASSVCAAEGVPGQEDVETQTRLSSIEVYDRTSDRYVFEVGGSRVSMSVPTGIITNSSVLLDVPAGLPVKIYRDGVQLTEKNISSISEPGGYVVLLGSNDALRLDFTIVGEYSGNIVQYSLPAGFSMIGATLDAQPIHTTETSVDMRGEGSYVIEYGCQYIGKTYRLEFKADHTAPVLELTGLENNYAEGPVGILVQEEGCSLTLTQDGKEIDFRSPVTAPGNYTVTAKDAAGNSAVYAFTIGLYFTLNHFTVFIILAAVLLALAAYMWVSRRRLRIR